MAEGTEIGKAYVTVNLDDQTEGDYAKIKGKLEAEKPFKFKTELGEPDLGPVRERVRGSEPIKLPLKADNPVDAAWKAQVEASLKATAKEALKIPVTPESEMFKRDLAATIREAEQALHAKIPADVADAAAFKAKVEALAKTAGDEAKARIKVEVDKESEAATVSETERLAGRINSQFGALAFAGLSFGLPAAAAVGAAGAAAALTVADAAFLGVGIAAAKSSDTVQTAWSGTAQHVEAVTQVMAQGLQGPLAESAQHVSDAFDRMAPAIQTGMNASASSVLVLTDAATGLAERALPGLVTAAQQSDQAVEGLGNFARSTGSGVSDMFTAIAGSSANAGAGMTQLGQITASLLGFVGQLTANLAANHAQLGILQGGLASAESGLLALTTAGSGAVGFLSGFGTAAGGAIAVLNGVAQVLSVLPAGVTQFGGSVTAASAILGKFGVDATKGFDGLGEKISTVAKTGKGFGDVFAGLAAGAFNPAALAALGLGLVLDQLGRSSQQAAENAAEFKGRVQDLTAAFQQDKGVMGEVVNQTNAKALADKNAASNLATFGQSISTASMAIQGNSTAYGALKTSAESALGVIGQQAGLTDEAKTALAGLAGTSLTTGQNYSQLRDKVIQYGTVLDASAGSSQRLTASQQAQIEALLNGTGAVGEQIAAQKKAHDAYLASEAALTHLNSAQIEARDSATGMFNATMSLINAQLGLQGAQLNTIAATDTWSKTMKNSKATADEKAKATLGLEQAEQAEIAAAQKSGEAASKATSAQAKQADGMRAGEAEAIKLANAFSGPLPNSLQQTISKMSATDAKAVGLKLTVNNLGQAVYQLPNGKQIVIDSNADQQIAKMQAVADKINAIPTKKYSEVDITTIYRQVGTAAVATGINAPSTYLYGPHSAKGGFPSEGVMKRFADGGLAASLLDVSRGGLLKGPGTWTSDSIPTLFSNGMVGRTANEEFVVNAAATQKWLPTLEAINAGVAPIAPKSFASVGASPAPSPAPQVSAPGLAAVRDDRQTVTNNTINQTIITQDPAAAAHKAASDLAWALRIRN